MLYFTVDIGWTVALSTSEESPGSTGQIAR